MQEPGNQFPYFLIVNMHLQVTFISIPIGDYGICSNFSQTAVKGCFHEERVGLSGRGLDRSSHRNKSNAGRYSKTTHADAVGAAEATAPLASVRCRTACSWGTANTAVDMMSFNSEVLLLRSTPGCWDLQWWLSELWKHLSKLCSCAKIP